VLHGIQANSQSNQPIVQVNARASGEGYGLESSTDRSILWLVNLVSILFIHVLVDPLADTLPRAMNSLLTAKTEDLFIHRQCGMGEMAVFT
jgi:hypothetical protein